MPLAVIKICNLALSPHGILRSDFGMTSVERPKPIWLRSSLALVLSVRKAVEGGQQTAALH